MVDTSLILCAHPDDEILGVGGTIAKYNIEGRKVITVIFSYGEGSHPWMKKKVTVETRINESQTADKIVGCKKTMFLGVNDAKISEKIQDNKLEKKVEDIIKKIKPNRIFTHTEDDPLPDHRAVNQIVLSACKKIKFKGDIYAFEIWGPIKIKGRNSPKLIIDITTTFKTKLKALNSFKSQKIVMLQLIPSAYIRATLNGFNTGFRYAEKFYKIK